ncbi:hypothetical protein BM1374166_01564 [Bartonella tribocorum]|nr:hypothetical protein BM1374166_01564 [Bartonella tribocorum]
MIAKKPRKDLRPKKESGHWGPRFFSLNNLRAYRTWEIAGTQDTAPDTKKTLIIPHQYLHNTPINICCQHKFYHKF